MKLLMMGLTAFQSASVPTQGCQTPVVSEAVPLIELVEIARETGNVPIGQKFVSMPFDGRLEFDKSSGTISVAYLEPNCSLEEHSVPPEMLEKHFGKPAQYGLGKVYCIDREYSQEPGRSYTATNGYGVSFEVDVVNRHRMGVYLGFGSPGQSWWQGRAQGAERPVFEIRVTPEEAESLTVGAVLIFELRMTRPTAIKTNRRSAATFGRPFENRIRQEYVVADVACVTLADANAGRIYQSRLALLPQ